MQLKIKDLVYIGIIALLFFMYILRKPKVDTLYKTKYELLELSIKAKQDSIAILRQSEKSLGDTLEKLKNQRININEKIKDIKKEIPAKIAIVDALDVQHLEEFLSKYPYESQ